MCIFILNTVFSYDKCVIFFFKQKTAYDMRISDWSSDVCSSDLFARFIGERAKVGLKLPQDGRRRLQGVITAVDGERIAFDVDGTPVEVGFDNIDKARLVRSEEHTSELQSLMCISYAVFCLKKKNKQHYDDIDM